MRYDRILWIGFGLMFLAAWSIQSARADGPNQAGLVIEFGDGTTQARCVSFSEASMSGYELLQRSGLAVEVDFSQLGAAVCSIDHQGCPVANCLQCDPQYRYWSYWRLNGTTWQYSSTGASNTQVLPGQVDGWRWGSGQAPDSVVTFESICQPATQTPTRTGTATPSFTPRTPTVTSSMTQSPTSTTQVTPPLLALASATVTRSPSPNSASSTPGPAGLTNPTAIAWLTSSSTPYPSSTKSRITGQGTPAGARLVWLPMVQRQLQPVAPVGPQLKVKTPKVKKIFSAQISAQSGGMGEPSTTAVNPSVQTLNYTGFGILFAGLLSVLGYLFLRRKR